MKSLMEIYTQQIKWLLGFGQGMKAKLLSMPSSMEQGQKKSEASLEVRKEMAKELKKSFSEQHQVLEVYEKRWMGLLSLTEDGLKDLMEEKSSSDDEEEEEEEEASEEDTAAGLGALFG